ncbi:related to isopenicillin N synthetase [Phialocephala subalpina]|uniref:Related to isopenicillin N synthetase n=1 Tax=Phialocephala subalpina TaxID=576137 RepID=A0A1L7XQH2_9HELO|nr:related to isopenicillin N synthetase [Phialocephala subalpina]
MSTTMTETAQEEPQYEYYYRDHTWENKREILRGSKAVETFDEMPLIDIGDIFSESYSERLRKAKEVAEVCKTVGFMYIKNHGISQELIDDVFEFSKTYHAQDLEKKKEEYVYKSETLRGYDIHYTKTPEGLAVKKESFMYSYNPDNDPQPPNLTPEQYKQCIGLHNMWPIQIPGFQPKCLEYFSELLKLSRRLMRTFALGLGAEETYFDDIITAPYVSIILQHYPPRAPGAEDLDGLGAHSDFETFTILNQDMVGGLEILNKNGIYVPAKPIRGTFVVNIGDFLQRISNDTFVSTVHRARNTSGLERYSIPFFLSFNVDAEVSVMPACVSETNPAKYGPRNLHEYTARRRQLQKEAHEKGTLEDALV